MTNLLGNLRYGIRVLRQRPGLTVIAVLALGLGIGVTTTMYSIVHGALRELPFEESGRILHLERSKPSEGITSMEVTQHDFVDWRRQQSSFEDLSAFYSGTVNVAGTERPVRYDGAFITPGAFEQLRVQPILGRTFTQEEGEPGAQPVLLLSHRVWRDDFGGDPDVVGREVRVNGQPGTVIGVMPEGFQFPFDQRVWVPLKIDLSGIQRGEGTTLEVFGRLASGVSVEQAQAEFATIARNLGERYPETNEGVGVVIKPYVEEYIGEEIYALLYTMLGAVFLVLVVACANVANLLLSRAFDRSQEVAVRTALGASRWQVVSQFLTEAFLLSAMGGLLGLILGRVGIGLFNAAIVDVERPYWIDIRIDPVVLLFVAGIVGLSTLMAGVFPALQASGSDVNEILKDESRGSSSLRLGRLSKGLVIAEVALSCGLLVGAGLMIKSVTKLANLDYGFPTEDVFTARVGLFEGDYPEQGDRERFFEELEERLASLPGARAAAVTSALPGSQRAGWTRLQLEGGVYSSPEELPRARSAIVSPGFFETFEVEALQGRLLDSRDDSSERPVAVVNVSFVQQHFDGENAVGRRFRPGGIDSDEPWISVVGVVPDLRIQGIQDNEDTVTAGYYVPLHGNAPRFMSLAVRTPGEPMSLTSAVRSQVNAIDPDLPIYWVRTLQETLDQETWFYRIFGGLFMIFGFVALFLASVGLYGVMSFSVRRRTREVGVRMALGARTGDVLRHVLRQGMTQTGIGLVAGLVLAWAGSGLIELILYQVEPNDPLVYGTIAAALAVTGVLACLVPALRAARVDPAEALRIE